jgi:L,D-transpeptidase ErfK/SrfK
MIKYIALFILSTLLPSISFASPYGHSLCKQAQYVCHQVKWGESWYSLFRDPYEMMMVKKINRKNTPLRSGMVIAIPRNLGSINSTLELSPLPHQIPSSSSNSIKVDLSKLAWGAYDSQGTLVNWGPISGGQDFCPDINRKCRTVTGTYTIYQKKGADCISSKFPLPNGGAEMPYCMHFHGGYALHASGLLPGQNASHGCIRLLLKDAKWLNTSFVKVGKTRVTISN